MFMINDDLYDAYDDSHHTWTPLPRINQSSSLAQSSVTAQKFKHYTMKLSSTILTIVLSILPVADAFQISAPSAITTRWSGGHHDHIPLFSTPSADDIKRIMEEESTNPATLADSAAAMKVRWRYTLLCIWCVTYLSHLENLSSRRIWLLKIWPNSFLKWKVCLRHKRNN